MIEMTRRGFMGSAAFGDSLYVIGGISSPIADESVLADAQRAEVLEGGALGCWSAE